MNNIQKLFYLIAGLALYSVSHAAIVLENYDLAVGDDPIDGSTSTYNTGGQFFTDYNTTYATYTEADLSANGWTTGEQQRIVSTVGAGGSFNGVLRYNITQRDENEPFIADLKNNPIFSFDARLDASQTTANFTTLLLNVNTNAAGAGSFGTFNPTTSIQTFTHDLWNDPGFQTAWTNWKNGEGTFFQIRIVQQSQNLSGVASAVEYDNITLVPEPSTFALFAGFLVLGLVMLRRRLKD